MVVPAVKIEWRVGRRRATDRHATGVGPNGKFSTVVWANSARPRAGFGLGTVHQFIHFINLFPLLKFPKIYL
jgi:hypothetical protein